MHQLRDESVRLMERGGLWKYSGDSHETLQALAKCIWLDLSARGGGGRGRLHPCQIVMERHFMRTHVCTTDWGPHKLFMLHAEERKLKERVDLLAP